jgi:hypothetical protein
MTHINHVHVVVWDQRYLTSDWQTLQGMEDEKEDAYRVKFHVFCPLHGNNMT